MAADPLTQLRANRRKASQLDADLPALVYAAHQADYSWQEIAAVLGVKKARVYQLIKAGAP
jgi:predicted DNA-binding protein YlxM (UPF0122 family)